jgi:hypothetical protein
MGAPTNRALVLGAGIQGVCAALALTRDGWSVTLVDRAVAPMRGASRRGEGKIHLGYVYGNEPSRATAELMIEGAITFAGAIDSWLPTALDWGMLRSAPFNYAVVASSMVTADELEAHYAWVDDRLETALEGSGGYLGAGRVRRTTRARSVTSLYGPDVTDVFTTDEVAVDPRALAGHLIEGIEAAGVAFLASRTVRHIERTSQGFVVDTCDADGSPRPLVADIVVNCLWDGRLAIDADLGITPPRPWVYRLKYGVSGTNPTDIPSTTFVLGPLGDVVQRRDGRCYLSWYPECLAGWSDDLVVPTEWSAAIRGDEPRLHQADVARRAVQGIAPLLPSIVDFHVTEALAGVIVAWGESDIDDPTSALHGRDAIGVHANDGYFSIDTGKLTTAPLFATRLAAMVRS